MPSSRILAVPRCRVGRALCGCCGIRLATRLRADPLHRRDGPTAAPLEGAGTLERLLPAGASRSTDSESRSVESQLPLRSVGARPSASRPLPEHRRPARRSRGAFAVRALIATHPADAPTVAGVRRERSGGRRSPRGPLRSCSREPSPSPYLNAHVKGYILDETLIKQSAVHYTTDLPSSLFDDVNARATSRLYSLLMAPLFAIGHWRCGGTLGPSDQRRALSLAPRCLSTCLLASCLKAGRLPRPSSRSWRSSCPGSCSHRRCLRSRSPTRFSFGRPMR